VRCAARECLRSFRLTSGVERRWSGGLIRRALVRAQRHEIASRRPRGLNPAVMEARFGCEQLWLRGIDVLALGRRLGRCRQQRTMVRRRDLWVRAAMPVRRAARASDRVAREKQQERHGKQAHQDTGSCRRHVRRCALTNFSNVRGSALPIKRQLTDGVLLRWIRVRFESVLLSEIQQDRVVDTSEASECLNAYHNSTISCNACEVVAAQTHRHHDV
jgi:hypothetical protein